MSYTRLLQQIAATAPFDFSATQAVSDWIMTALTEHSSVFNNAYTQAQALHDDVVLHTGQGLSPIWSAFLAASSSWPLRQRCLDLERYTMGPGTDCYLSISLLF
jgi:hypothetical protein